MLLPLLLFTFSPLTSLQRGSFLLQVVSSLVQLQDLASYSSRSEPLHVIASVHHPRTLELINYVTQHTCSTGVSGQKVIGAVKAATGDPHHASHGAHVSRQGLEHVGGDALSKSAPQRVALSVDMLLPDELLSGLLTQVSVQPELLSVMNDLFDAEGTAIPLLILPTENDTWAWQVLIFIPQPQELVLNT